MNLMEKADYLYEYYKLPILLILILVFVTETHTNGMDLSQMPKIRDAGFSGDLARILGN